MRSNAANPMFAAVMPSPYATNTANLIEILTYCRARA
jgi:hypothetical protein